ncbi:MAG: hypothetical protein ACOH13_15700 [Flavobacteriales bacterium]
MTIVHLLGWALLLLVVVLTTYGISVWRGVNEHSSDVHGAISFQTTDRITARIDLTNAGDRPAAILFIVVEFTNQVGDRVNVSWIDSDTPEELNVPAQGMIIKRVAIAYCPESITMPVAHLTIRNFNGTVQKIDIASGSSMSCTGLRLMPPT